MNDFDDVRAALTAYARAYIRALSARDYNDAQIAKALNCSHAYVSQLRTPEKYPNAKIGHEMEHRLAALLHGGSIDGLRKSAQLTQAGGAVIVLDGTTGETIALPSGETVNLSGNNGPSALKASPSAPPDRPKRRGTGTRSR